MASIWAEPPFVSQQQGRFRAENPFREEVDKVCGTRSALTPGIGIRRAAEPQTQFERLKSYEPSHQRVLALCQGQ